MAFDLELTVTGICAFVQNEITSGRHRVCLAMPSTDIEKNALDDEPLCPHECYIEQGYGFARTKTSIKEQRVTFEYRELDPEANPPLDRLPIATYDDPGLLNLIDTGVDNRTDPSMVSFSRPPSLPVMSQIFLDKGWIDLSDDEGHWAIAPNDPRGVRAAHEVIITLRGLETARAVLQPFNYYLSTYIDLTPSAEISKVALRIVNTCERSVYPRSTSYPTRSPRRDRDFKWYYELLKDPGSIIEGNKDLQIPRYMSPQLIGGNNCFPARLEPASFQ